MRRVTTGRLQNNGTVFLNPSEAAKQRVAFSSSLCNPHARALSSHFTSAGPSVAIPAFLCTTQIVIKQIIQCVFQRILSMLKILSCHRPPLYFLFLCLKPYSLNCILLQRSSITFFLFASIRLLVFFWELLLPSNLRAGGDEGRGGFLWRNTRIKHRCLPPLVPFYSLGYNHDLDTFENPAANFLTPVSVHLRRPTDYHQRFQGVPPLFTTTIFPYFIVESTIPGIHPV